MGALSFQTLWRQHDRQVSTRCGVHSDTRGKHGGAWLPLSHDVFLCTHFLASLRLPTVSSCFCFYNCIFASRTLGSPTPRSSHNLFCVSLASVSTSQHGLMNSRLVRSKCLPKKCAFYQPWWWWKEKGPQKKACAGLQYLSYDGVSLSPLQEGQLFLQKLRDYQDQNLPGKLV